MSSPLYSEELVDLSDQDLGLLLLASVLGGDLRDDCRVGFENVVELLFEKRLVGFFDRPLFGEKRC